ncbi:MAG TPA: hypothetical protein VF310_14295 [Vicinamibacteria bacterium]
MTRVWVEGRALSLNPASAIGSGGEAEVFDVGGGWALKLFKPPDHPDYAHDPALQAAAGQRLAERQRKLAQFPRALPPRVVRPEKLATARDGRRVLGYTMRLLAGAEALCRYGEPAFRQAGVTGSTVVDLFRDLHATLSAVHAAGVVVGDLNDLNVLVVGTQAHLIDADSFQFPPFLCTAFTERFVDPLLCDPGAARPLLARPFTAESDWYAFAVMLMRSLLFVDPYGGVFKPAAGQPPVPAPARPLRRLTVFHPQVRYPRPGLRRDTLPDELLHHFEGVFVHDRRGAFPRALLEGLRFTRCLACGAEHARALCPACLAAGRAAVREVTVVRGGVSATRTFHTRGAIVCAAIEDGGLRVLVHEDGALKREDGSRVLEGELPPGTTFGLAGPRTLLARSGRLLTVDAGAAAQSRSVDGAAAAFAPGGRLYWIEGGSLLREGRWGPERVGDVLAGHTRFWVGPEFGLGFWRAGGLQAGFVFGAGRGLDDRVAWPRLAGHLLDARCFFGRGRAWLLTATRDAGRAHHRCLVVRADGSVEAQAEAEPGDGSWLASLDGKCAAGGILLSATDEGLVRVEVDQGHVVKTREFPETEPFVHPGHTLLAGGDGLYVVDRQEVRRLRLTAA